MTAGRFLLVLLAMAVCFFAGFGAAAFAEIVF